VVSQLADVLQTIFQAESPNDAIAGSRILLETRKVLADAMLSNLSVGKEDVADFISNNPRTASAPAPNEAATDDPKLAKLRVAATTAAEQILDLVHFLKEKLQESKDNKYTIAIGHTVKALKASLEAPQPGLRAKCISTRARTSTYTRVQIVPTCVCVYVVCLFISTAPLTRTSSVEPVSQSTTPPKQIANLRGHSSSSLLPSTPSPALTSLHDHSSSSSSQPSAPAPASASVSAPLRGISTPSLTFQSPRDAVLLSADRHASEVCRCEHLRQSEQGARGCRKVKMREGEDEGR